MPTSNLKTLLKWGTLSAIVSAIALTQMAGKLDLTALRTPYSSIDSGSSAASSATPPNSVQTLIDDMTLPHQGRPAGVPDHYDWATSPRMGYGNEPSSFTAMTAWGQVYEDAQGNPAQNTRVQLGMVRSYLLSQATGEWILVQDAPAEGAAYANDYQGNVNQPADIRDDEGDTISVKAGQGYNFHFWPRAERATFDPSDIAGVFTTVQARLVVDDPTLPDDRATARYLLGMGGDYWLDADAEWDGFQTNGDIAIGRFKYVTSEWQAFNMTTLDAQQLRRNPPPLR
ncbi:MAG: hypothetical protein KME20_18610 [Kaiparowitsia implicata GSE-PSE-MK54-09C]|jgi:hypothetical protein|nr:hypothetical protein [Kaiparowitsia implicata GSE-PSE-MK54-09C]